MSNLNAIKTIETTVIKAKGVCEKLLTRLPIVFVCVVLSSGTAFSAVDLVDEPLFLKTGAGANVLLNMSVETPMGGGAYNDAAGSIVGCTGRKSATGQNNVGTCYFPTFEYIGYFDPKKCYSYGSSRFTPSDNASSDHSCDDGQSGRWSGNFLNWASMTAIDTYMLTMTGGRRVVDTTSQTVVERSLSFVAGYAFHTKAIGSSVNNSIGNVALDTVTPYNDNWGRIVQNQNSTEFRLERSGGGSNTFNVAVEVCKEDSSLINNGIEGNCVARTDGTSNYYKPEGLIQNNSKKLRFGVMAYTTDNSHTRHGGVLRSNMKSVGPELGTGEVNTLAEYGDDGIFITNPTGASSGNSGVINYVNKFAKLAGQYKSYDPVSELFYEAIRFYKNIGPTPENYSGLSAANNGGFPIITSWEDPIQYECQTNFMVAINDAFPWNDKRLPGTHFNSSPVTDALGRSISFSRDGGEPSNADTDINVTDLANTVGDLENTESGGELVTKLGTKDIGELLAPGTGANLTPTNGNGRGNSYYLAGLGYYGNTQDLRSDAHLPGEQTVSTFMIDSQEYNNNPILGNVNPLWLAGKYGGFVDANNDDIPQLSEWDADGDGLPDNYVLATEPKKMVDKLQESFDAISQITAASGSAVAINSTVLNTNSRIYQATFNSTDWSGDLNAYSLNADGTLNAKVWNANSKLPAHAARKIYTTVDVSGTPTAKTFTDANVTLSSSGGTTTTVVVPVTGATATANSECNYETTGPASKVVDGNTDGNFTVSPGSVNHTCGLTSNDWIDVDLQSVKDISHINIYNRSDSVHERRLSNTLLMVAETPFPADLASSLTHANYFTQLTGEPIRINMGATVDYTDSLGREWLADSSNPPLTSKNGGRNSNSAAIVNTNSSSLLGGTVDEAIYKTERRRNNEVNLEIAIPDPSVDQWVILHLSDSSGGSSLVVDIEIDGDIVADDYDIGAVGQDTAQVLAYKRNVGSTLEIDIKEESGGNPRINAIEIIPEITSNVVTANVGIPGRYIKLQKPGGLYNKSNFLHIAEVEAHETATVTVGGPSNTDIVNYIRGDQSNEESQSTSGIFRDRTSLIGDLVNSTPITSSTENFFNNNLPGSEGSSYEAYVESKITKFKSGSNFFNLVYVGSNGGMLHAFQDTTDTDLPNAGKEVFSYIPSHIHPKLDKLTEPSYRHENFVNGPPHRSDAYISSAWRTMLVGAFGSGAKGLYALNITDPMNFDASDVMWEFKSDSDVSNGSNEIGFVLTSPKIARFNNGKWGVIFGNGYNSASQKSQLFILDAADGSIMKVINTNVGSVANPNGLSEPLLVDQDSDRIVDTVYAGDLHGKLWKFDLSDASEANWKVAYETTGSPVVPLPLFSATDAAGNQQAITSRPALAFNPHASGDFNILFGTGKYMEIGDNVIPTNPAQNTMYSVNDAGAANTAGRSSLVAQTVLSEQDEIDDNGTPGDTSDDTLTNRVRITSDQQVNYFSKKGWYMDLLSPDGPDTGTAPDPYGERIVASPLSRFGRTIFTTYIPSSNPCDGGGVSLLMSLDALTGSRLTESIFDVNQDGFIDFNDLVAYTGSPSVASGIFIDATISNTVILSGSDGSVEHALVSYNSGGTGSFDIASDPTQVGRQSWRQLQ